MDQTKLLRFAAISGLLAVALGAFGAHGLQQLATDGKITADDLKTYETAVRYQFYHTLALLLLPVFLNEANKKLIRYTAICFQWGIVVFSGSLYLLSVSGYLFGTAYRWLGAITPLGGLLFLAGWLMLVLSAGRRIK